MFTFPKLVYKIEKSGNKQKLVHHGRDGRDSGRNCG